MTIDRGTDNSEIIINCNNKKKNNQKIYYIFRGVFIIGFFTQPAKGSDTFLLMKIIQCCDSINNQTI